MKRDEIRIRDPYILADDDVYYLFGTTGENVWKGRGKSFECYRSTDLQNFEGPFTAFVPPTDFWADENFWGPEIHKYRGRYYMFASFYKKELHRGTQILASDSPMGPYVPITDGPYTPADWECLDGTFYRENGKVYSVFSHEWQQIRNGSIELVEMSADLTYTITEPKTLFHASDAPWVRPIENSADLFVTDGPFLWKLRCGTLAMLWSSFGEEGYALGVAYSEGGIHGPWVQEAEPLFRKDGGHGMIFSRKDGTWMVAMHYPNCFPERLVLFQAGERDGKLVLIPEETDHREEKR